MNTYKLKQGLELPKEFKIKVNEDQSKALQEYLFSIGYSWLNDEKRLLHLDDKMLGFEDSKLYRITAKISFNIDNNKKIRFKDYFEKVEDTFPEKWCILVTEDNYRELDVWMHLNKGNYYSYNENWSCIVGEYLYSESITYGCCQAKQKCLLDHKLITTEQFRNKYGYLKPKDVEFLSSDEKEKKIISCKDMKYEYGEGERLLDYFDNLKTLTPKINACTENYPLENQKLKNEIAQLKSELSDLKKFGKHYYKNKCKNLRVEIFEIKEKLKIIIENLNSIIE